MLANLEKKIGQLENGNELLFHQQTLAALTSIHKPFVTDDLDHLVTRVEAFMTLTPIPTLKRFLATPCVPYIVETCGIISDIVRAGPTYCDVLVNYGIHCDICALVLNPSADVVKQACWVIGNMALEGIQYRDLLIDEGVVISLCKSFRRPEITIENQNDLSWAVANLCKTRPVPATEHLIPIFDLFEHMLREIKCKHSDMLEWLMWAGYYITQEPIGIELSMANNIPELTQKLFRPDTVLPGLRDSAVIPRRLPSEQLGEVFEYLPKRQLAQVATLSKDIFDTTVCDNEELYTRLRGQFEIPEKIRVPFLKMCANVFSLGTDAQAAACLNFGVLDMLESIASGGLSELKRRDFIKTIVNITARGEASYCSEVAERPKLTEMVSSILKTGGYLWKETIPIIINFWKFAPNTLLENMEVLCIPAIASFLDPKIYHMTKPFLAELHSQAEVPAMPQLSPRALLAHENVINTLNAHPVNAELLRRALLDLWNSIKEEVAEISVSPENAISDRLACSFALNVMCFSAEQITYKL